ncbi:hypothetical protein PQR05_37485 [Paraburkholderia sediminicola]|uniref:hypothetical protein n=1 Tax=Paraburkholderia sediminicola TaxID=458836 RepID=UPI0038B8D8C9
MDLNRLVPVLRWVSRIGKIGLFLMLGTLIGGDMLVQAFGGSVDEKALVASAMPLLVIFALLGAGGEILVRTFGSGTKAKR